MPNEYREIINDCLSSLNASETRAATAAAMKALESSNRAANNNLLLGEQFPHMMLEGDSDETESAASGMPEEDPNDPEWREPATKPAPRA